MSAAQPVTADPSQDPPPLTAKIEVRLTEELKARALVKARREGKSVSSVLRRGLESWVDS